MTSLLETLLMPHEVREDAAQHVIQRPRGPIDADHTTHGLKGQTAQVQSPLPEWYVQQAGGYRNIKGAIALFK
jgi:hypothetical protein